MKELGNDGRSDQFLECSDYGRLCLASVEKLRSLLLKDQE
jgi:hypothetical protein